MNLSKPKLKDDSLCARNPFRTKLKKRCKARHPKFTIDKKGCYVNGSGEKFLNHGFNGSHRRLLRSKKKSYERPYFRQ